MWLVFFASCAFLLASVSFFLSFSLWSRRSDWLNAASLSQRLEAYSAQSQRAFESRVRSLEVEWEDTWQKMNRLTGRMERAKQLASARSAEPGTLPVGNGTDGTPSSVQGLGRHERKVALMRRYREQTGRVQKG